MFSKNSLETPAKVVWLHWKLAIGNLPHYWMVNRHLPRDTPFLYNKGCIVGVPSYIIKYKKHWKLALRLGGKRYFLHCWSSLSQGRYSAPVCIGRNPHSRLQVINFIPQTEPVMPFLLTLKEIFLSLIMFLL